MNTHLDIDHLLTEPVSEQARGHLAGCAACQTEATRWESVADGVRELMADTPRLPALRVPATDPIRTEPARRRQRTAWLAAAAAAVVMLGGVGYGLATRTRSPSSPVPTALAAVRGCAALKQVYGTLTQVNSTSAVIDTTSGQAVTVTTTATTAVNLTVLPLSDITDNATVTVVGPVDDGIVQARSVILGLKPGQEELNSPGSPAPNGTVTHAYDGGFTFTPAGGSPIQVVTSAATEVDMFNASLSQLQTGRYTTALGFAGPDGTLAANLIMELPNRHVWMSQVGCTPSSIAYAYALALGSAG
jgi:anti-sigma factor RsiW